MTRVGSPPVCESTNGTECMTPSDARFHGCQIAHRPRTKKSKMSRKADFAPSPPLATSAKDAKAQRFGGGQLEKLT
jgi:hypothetical protein